MDRYEISSMFGQGTFGRLYKAHLKADLTDQQLPIWVNEITQRRLHANQTTTDPTAPTPNPSFKCAYGDTFIHGECKSASELSGAATTTPSSTTSSPVTTPETASIIAAIRSEMLVIKEVPFDGLPIQEQQDILNEVRVMSAVNHSSFIAYYESFLANGCLYIVMELAAGGDLAQLLNSRKPNPMSEPEMWRYLIQLLEGLSYLHSQRILHRDIKPANIFLDQELNVKIGDLGLGRILGSKSVVARTGVGTPLYFSPELCMDRPYDEKSDVWSLGCLMYEMCTFQPPFLASNQIALAKKIVQDTLAPLPARVSPELRSVIGRMLEKEPQNRPSIDQMLLFSPVKLRRQQMQLTANMEQLQRRMKHQQAYVDDLKKHHQQDLGLLKYQLQQEQLAAQQAQRRYEEVFTLLQSAESAHSKLVDHVYALEHTNDSHTQLFEQYQMQLARTEQERHQAENERVQMDQKMRAQEQQLKQQQLHIQSLTALLEQTKLEQTKVPNQYAPMPPVQTPLQSQPPPPHPQMLKQSSYPLPTASPPMQPIHRELSHREMTTPVLQSAVAPPLPSSISSTPAGPSPLPSKCTSPTPMQLPPPTTTTTSNPLTSPQPSPSITRFTSKLGRTPNLGPALRVPARPASTNNTNNHNNTNGSHTHSNTSPTKSHLNHHQSTTTAPSTITPTKKTPTSSKQNSYQSNVAPTPIPKLEWTHLPVTNSPKQPQPRKQHDYRLRDDFDDSDVTDINLEEQPRSLFSLPQQQQLQPQPQPQQRYQPQPDTPPQLLTHRSLQEDYSPFMNRYGRPGTSYTTTPSGGSLSPTSSNSTADPTPVLTPNDQYRYQYQDGYHPLPHAVNSASEFSARLADAATTGYGSPMIQPSTTNHFHLKKEHVQGPLNSEQLELLLSEFQERFELQPLEA